MVLLHPRNVETWYTTGNKCTACGAMFELFSRHSRLCFRRVLVRAKSVAAGCLHGYHEVLLEVLYEV